MNISVEEKSDNIYNIIVDHNNGMKTIYEIPYRDLHQLYNNIQHIINQKESNND